MNIEQLKAQFAANVAKYRAQGKSESFIAAYVRKWWEVDDRLRGRRA
jgi:hypothetical protein